MNFGGLIKISLSNYPKRVASCFFTQGCNFKCIYCHNSHLIKPMPEIISVREDIQTVLQKRTDFIDGVVISGGEPTLQKQLPTFLEKLKKLGLYTKLDTNGTRPECLKSLLSNGLIDYVAMDIKAPLEKYSQITKVVTDWRKIEESILLISEEVENKEFRTTVIRPYITEEDIQAIGTMIHGTPLILQRLVSKNTLDNSLSTKNEPQQEWLMSIATNLYQNGTTCIVR